MQEQNAKAQRGKDATRKSLVRRLKSIEKVRESRWMGYEKQPFEKKADFWLSRPV